MRQDTLILRKLLLSAGILLATASLAHANSSLGLGNPEPGAGPPSAFVMHYMPWLEPVIFFINAKQQEFYRALTMALKGMRTDSWQLWWLVGVSFVYGVFHAAGPGHGKAVISSYMIANETELKRGVAISFLSALVQGLVAILVTAAGFLILRGSTITMTDASRWLEVASFALIVVFGLYLLFRKLKSMLWRPSMNFATAGPELAVADGISFREGLDHGHRHGAGLVHTHAHAAGEVCTVCGHAHVPSPAMVSGDRFSLADAWTAIMAVGLRPCSGAIFVLTFAFLNGLYIGGVLSVMAMSIGTAITVSILATIAVTAKDAALKFAGEGASALRIGNAIEILGAVFITLFGLTFLMASLQG
ncbi:MAG: putative nickel transporter, permease protein [Rhizobium sp.]|nr:putative nickel transporter, permease protein [Rhizobium sp.]